MKCGNCKGDHESVAEVKECYGVVANPGVYIEPAGKPFKELSEKMYNFINKLRIERGEKPFLEGYEEASETQSFGWAKWEIGRLQGIPKTSAASALDKIISTITEGFYAVNSLSGNNDLDFYKVEKPTSGLWAGFTFVKMIVGGKPEYNVKGARRHDVLKAIAEADPDIAAMVYSQETNDCNKCGINLTKYASRQLGNGYTCAERRGLGPEWLRLQHQWEAYEKAGLHAIQEVQGELDREAARTGTSAAGMSINTDPFESTLDHDEYAKFERVAARENDSKYDLEPDRPVGTPGRELSDSEDAAENVTWK